MFKFLKKFTTTEEAAVEKMTITEGENLEKAEDEDEDEI